jgi:hypothetical protein
MIRFLLLGGRWGPVPWNVFVALGASCLMAMVLVVLLYPLWSTLPLLGAIETTMLSAAGAGLLGVGAHRRAREVRAAGIDPGRRA